ncbi:hypothetical protein J6590_037152 [Homalodisca vitripennis]|nr:hypothetical protein J6590_037152 [Homalodisca vitripennis]
MNLRREERIRQLDQTLQAHLTRRKFAKFNWSRTKKSLSGILYGKVLSLTMLRCQLPSRITPCSTEVSLTVRVLEESAPKFDRSLYTVTVPENLPPHSLLPLLLSAEAPFSHSIVYSIPDIADRIFSVDVTAGALFTEERLDYETAPLLEATVRATDSQTGESRGGSEIAEVVVTVLLTDVNDNPPRFPQTHYNITLSESTPVGARIGVIQADDIDTGVNGLVQYSISPQHGAVRVDSSDGSLYLQQPLDRELNSTFHLVLMASDSGLPKLYSYADVWLYVLDVNDNPPKFERPTYNCKLSEEAKSGQMVTLVHANDPDLDPLRYFIVAGNDLQIFRIDPKSGIITIFNIVRLAQPEPHVLNVSVSDGVHTSFCTVSVHVLLVNRHTPHFSTNQHEASVEEGKPAGTYVTTVSARDDDVGSHGKITYTIPSEFMRSMFSADAETGRIVTEQQLDRERDNMLELPILATDGAGRSDFSTVRVTVTDVNDNAPEFHFPEYHTCISANLTVDSVFLKVKASDRDTGPAALVEYSIYNLQSKRVKHLFGINPQTGSIVLLQAAAQYEGQHFQFFVRAADNGIPPLFSDAAVHVYILKRGDVPPNFHRRDQHVFVSEDASPGTVVTQVKLVVPVIVEYRLLSETSQFSIDTEGVIKLTSSLDREVIPSYTLGVLALKPPMSGFTEVYVSVVDVNDCPPKFHSSSYSVNTAENVPEGTSIVRVVADDQDEGGNGEVRYSINSSVFTVDPYSGWISTVSALDRETTPRHSVLLTAFDNGDPALSATATLNVNILDYNDSPPAFSDRTYVVSVKEDALVGAAILQLTVVDPDSGGLDYYITEGDKNSQFAIRSSGQLYLTQPLDRESVDCYELRVVVTDSKYVVETTVRIEVIDVNDNYPKCQKSNIEVDVAENIVPGSTVLTVIAEDPDLDPQLTYYLTGAYASHFYFNQVTGELKTALPLDRETVGTYSLVAHVQDRESPSWECTALLTIMLNDVNDNPPTFPTRNYTAAIPEDYPVGSFVTILHAIDADLGINRKIRYSIPSTDEEYFTIDPASGLVLIARPLDKGLKAKYSLTVEASDLGDPPLSSLAHLQILVVDVNDNPPEFSSRSYHALVSEDAPVGTEVTRVSATYLEDGVQMAVVYSIIAGNEFGKFLIEPGTDRIRVAETLDYEEARQYLLTVLATDAGEHPLSTHTTVNITVVDCNDNAPQFSQPSYSADISELAIVGATVIQISALDADSGKNGLVRYSLVGDKSREFLVDSHTGVVKLMASLDREKNITRVYGIDDIETVTSMDMGKPSGQFSSLLSLHVTVTGIGVEHIFRKIPSDYRILSRYNQDGL